MNYYPHLFSKECNGRSLITVSQSVSQSLGNKRSYYQKDMQELNPKIADPTAQAKADGHRYELTGKPYALFSQNTKHRHVT